MPIVFGATYASDCKTVNSTPLSNNARSRYSNCSPRPRPRCTVAPLIEVAFHEIGAWDSIADIVAAAWLIERSGATSWSCAPLPLGRGRVRSAHGWLPIPAPATALLLKGFPVFDDGLEGERVTPTGAAIIRHLDPSFEPRLAGPAVLLGRGYGFGTKTFPDFSNVLLVSSFDLQRPRSADRPCPGMSSSRWTIKHPKIWPSVWNGCVSCPGIYDVTQAPVIGKKGRFGHAHPGAGQGIGNRWRSWINV
jgi:uncharacterized protein (DUF111 family)